MVNLYGHFMLKPPGLWRCPWPAADHRGGHIKGGLVTRGGTARLMFEELPKKIGWLMIDNSWLLVIDDWWLIIVDYWWLVSDVDDVDVDDDDDDVDDVDVDDDGDDDDDKISKQNQNGWKDWTKMKWFPNTKLTNWERMERNLLPCCGVPTDRLPIVHEPMPAMPAMPLPVSQHPLGTTLPGRAVETWHQKCVN